MNRRRKRRRPPPAPQQHSPQPRTGFAIALLLSAGILAYVNSLDGVFVFDSIYSIRDNPHIRTLWPLSEAMSWPLLQGDTSVSRRPLLSLTFAVNQYLLGPAPWGYHVGNLLIHLAAGLLLFGIVRRTLMAEPWRTACGNRSTGLAAAVALLWLVHPLQTESVTYLAQRAESLMGMLYLLTLYAAVRGFDSPRPGPWYCAAVIACGLGMGVKEIMITAPLLVFLYDGVFVAGSYGGAWRSRWRFYLALAATWLVFAWLMTLGFDEASKDFTERSPWHYALAQTGVLLHYLRLIVWPDVLLINYHWPAPTSITQILPQGLVLLSLLLLTAGGLVRRKWYGYVGGWYFLVLGPSSSFVALSQHAAEHRTYLSSAAVLLLLVLTGNWLLRYLFAEHPERQRRIGLVVLCVIVVLLTARTVMRNYQYYSGVALWTDVIAHQPHNASAHFNLGLELADRNKLAAAAEQFELALRLNPDYVDSFTNLGIVLQRQGLVARAIEVYQSGLRIAPANFDLNHNLGTLYLTQGAAGQALGYLREAVRIRPRSHQAHHNLAQCFEDQGEFEQALKHYQTALDLAGLEISRAGRDRVRKKLTRK